jgi:hypothetical protein
MTTGQLFRGTMAAAIAFSVACGDSTGPGAAIDLTEEEVDDMMEAFSTIGTQPEGASNLAMLIVTINESFSCPDGGTMSESGNLNLNEQTGSMTIATTQDFEDCKGTSTSGRLWTFNGNPNLASNFSLTSNEQTGAFSMTGSQTGGLRVASDLGSGTCNFNLNWTLSSTPTTGGTDNIQGSLTGTVCGRSINVDLSIIE